MLASLCAGTLSVHLDHRRLDPVVKAAAYVMGVTLFRDIRYSDRPPEDR